MSDDINKLCLDGLALAELIIAFTNKKELSEHLMLFMETREALLILNSAQSLIERSKHVDIS